MTYIAQPLKHPRNLPPPWATSMHSRLGGFTRQLPTSATWVLPHDTTDCAGRPRCKQMFLEGMASVEVCRILSCCLCSLCNNSGAAANDWIKGSGTTNCRNKAEDSSCIPIYTIIKAKLPMLHWWQRCPKMHCRESNFSWWQWSWVKWKMAEMRSFAFSKANVFTIKSLSDQHPKHWLLTRQTFKFQQ